MRVHVVKKREEYGNYETFNWKMEEFRSLLNALDCDVCGEEYSNRFEVYLPTYEYAMEYLKDINKGVTEFENIDVDYVKDCLESLDYGTIEEVIEAMQTFYDERDKSSEYIEFVAW